MSEKYQNKYRIKSARHPLWNYGDAAAYFITICTKNREHYFGCVVDGIFESSAIGVIVKEEWEASPGIRPDMNLTLEAFVVMPNHFHAIIVIGGNEYNGGENNGGDGDGIGDGDGRDAMHCVSTTVETVGTTEIQNQFGPQSKNLASIIRGFKSSVTTKARLINPEFGWQTRFHDHIIRNEKSFQTISNYIDNNPSLWKDDKFFG